MSDVLIKWQQLIDLRNTLGDIIERLEDGRSHAADIRDAIGTPFEGLNELKEQAYDLEERWKHQRGRLAGDLRDIKDHCDAIYDEFKEFDSEAAAKFEGQE